VARKSVLGSFTQKERKKNLKKFIVLTLMIVVLFCAACGPAATPTPKIVIQTVVVPATLPPVPVDTPTPIVVQPTPPLVAATPEFTVNVPAGANCRSGPSTDYQILAGFKNGTTVQISGKSDPQNFPLWWYVTAPDGVTKCFVWSVLGTTSRNTDSVQVQAAPPLPYYPRGSRGEGEGMTVLLKNETDNSICRMIFYSQEGMIPPLKWDRGEFNPGASQYFTIPMGKYTVDVYNCKLVIKFTLKNIHINSRNKTLEIIKP